MNHQAEELFERQARWQKSRRKLSWAEKIRMAEGLRESVVGLKRGKRKAGEEKSAT